MGAINVYINPQEEPQEDPQELDRPFDESLREPLDTVGMDTGPDVIPADPVPEGSYEDPLSESCRGLTEDEVRNRGSLAMLMKLLGSSR